MTDTPAPGYENKLQALRLDYLHRLQREGAELKELGVWLSQDYLSGKDLERLHRLAHGLAGTGAVFGFPEVSKAAAPLDQMINDLPEDISPSEFRVMEELLFTLSMACTEATCREFAPDESQDEPASTVTGAYVLLVDDDAGLAALLASRLKVRGIHVVTAANGSEALKSIERHSPDLVVLDMKMPGLNGHDVLRRLKNDLQLSSIPVVMLSAGDTASDAEAAKQLGAIDYIVKHFQPDELVARLETLLDAARFHVLITDNDDMLLDLLREKFQQRGFRVSTQNDGREAWDFIFKTLPDLVILDRMMPGLDGMTVLRNMREEPETKDIPVIVLSARKEERDIKIGMDFGAQEYVTKPCDPDDLLNRSLALLHSSGSKGSRSQS